MKFVLFLLGVIALCGARILRTPDNDTDIIFVESEADLPSGHHVVGRYVGGSSGETLEVILTDVLYPPQPSNEPMYGQCTCPTSRSDTVLWTTEAVYGVSRNGTETCREGSVGCIKVGHSVSGKMCLNSVTYSDERCVVKEIAIAVNDSPVYVVYMVEDTHRPVCVCNSLPPGKNINTMFTIYYSRELHMNETDDFRTLSFVVFDKDTSINPGPVACDLSSGGYRYSTGMTKDGKFGIFHATIYTSAGRQISGECSTMTADGEFAYGQPFYLRIRDSPVCDCNGNSLSETYMIRGSTVFDKCYQDKCVCKPGWGGKDCSECLYKDIMFGCDANAYLLWIILSLVLLLCMITITVVSYFLCTRTAVYVYKKFKNE